MFRIKRIKYLIQTREHIFQFCIDCIVHNDDFLKLIFSLCSNMFSEMFYLLRCFAFTELKWCYASPILMCLLPNTLSYNGFLRMETQLNMKLQMNYLQKENWTQLMKRCVLLTRHIKFCTCDDSTPKQILACVGACESVRTPFTDTNKTVLHFRNSHWDLTTNRILIREIKLLGCPCDLMPVRLLFFSNYFTDLQTIKINPFCQNAENIKKYFCQKSQRHNFHTKKHVLPTIVSTFGSPKI